MNKLKCMLLVDDDETTNIIIKMLITDMGIAEALLQARNGKKGLELLNRCVLQQQQAMPALIQPPGVPVVLNMPVMDSF